MAKKITVRTMPGFYLVIQQNGDTELFLVDKNKICSCNWETCGHVPAVRQYLKNGNEPAPPTVENIHKYMWDRGECPICGEDTSPIRTGMMWKCTADSSHYWMWRGELGGAKKFLTSPGVCGKIWSAYGLTREEWHEI